MKQLNHSRNLAVRHRAGRLHVLFLLPGLIAGLGLILAGRVTAQTFTTLHSFTAAATPPSLPKNSDGITPTALALFGNMLYGAAQNGGASGWGTLFKLNLDGTDFTTLHSFSGMRNSDGATPQAPLVLSGTTLYGTARDSPSWSGGSIFKVDIDGTGFTTLYRFPVGTGSVFYAYSNSDGAYPGGGLILSGDTLYGAASLGGAYGQGTVFAVNNDGTGFTNLQSLTGPGDGGNGAELLLSGGTLYGTIGGGGTFRHGAVFAMNTDGTGFTNLHSFNELSDGAVPDSLVLSGNTLYGTAAGGGASGNGTVFAVNTDGTGFTTQYQFTATHTNDSGVFTNNDGAGPNGLILSGGRLYGTAWNGGSSGSGTAFAVNTDGTGFSVLHSFTTTSGPIVSDFGTGTNNDGALPGNFPAAGLILTGNVLYGTTLAGGSSGGGTIFSILLPPQLTMTRSRGNVILTWPTNYAGFILQSTTNLGSPVWTTNSPAPLVVDGHNTVTNPISGAQQFFRLKQ
jgi:uncharacterized repeat protein (TIGR03803 family)